MEEIWKDIPGYEGIYQVSNYGRILSFAKDKIGIYIGAQNYGRGNTYYIGFTLNKKSVLVHRLVAQLFIPNPNNLPCVDHMDFNTQNNRSDNLRWITRSENSIHSKDRLAILRRGELHWKSKLSDNDVLRLLELRKSGMKYPELSKIFGLKENTLCAIVTRGRKYLKNNSKTYQKSLF